MMDAADQESQRARLRHLLGDLPDQTLPPTVTVLERSIRDSYSLELLRLELNGLEPVPAYFVKPLSAQGPLPCILYNHAHGNDYVLGKNELLDGRAALPSGPYASALTQRGYAVLCIDAWCFGERHGRTESQVFKEMLWRGQVLWGMMLFDSLRAIDYLVTRPDIDPTRIGTLGLSMGSTMAWWLAALDSRIRLCIDLCCLTDFEALIAYGGLDLHGLYYYVPSLLKHFSTAEINALIAPRPHLSLAGRYDPLTPVAGLQRIDDELKVVYRAAGNEAGWQLKLYETAHLETVEMRRAVLDFLEHWMPV